MGYGDGRSNGESERDSRKAAEASRGGYVGKGRAAMQGNLLTECRGGCNM